jgi:hypothetical protein
MYRGAWATVVVLVVAIAAAYDVVQGNALRTLGVTGLGAAFAASFAFALAEDSPRRWWWTWRTLMWTALGMGALDVLTRTWSWRGLTVGTALVLTCPAVLRAARTRWLSWTLRHSGGRPESMDRRELLRRWEWTTALRAQEGTPVADLVGLVEERRGLLDVLERRDPSAFEAWLPTVVPDGRLPRDLH